MRRIITLTFIALLLSGCGETALADLPVAPSAPVTPTFTVTAQATPIPATYTPVPPSSTPTPTPTPKSQPLVVCGERPAALNPYTPSQTGYDVLAFIYTFPVEQEGYSWEPRLLTHIPGFNSGDVVTRNVTVQQGAFFLDRDGVVKTYFGSESLILTQMIVTYTLQANLKWSDSYALTTKDVIFGYSIAQMPEAYGQWRDLADRTMALTAIDDQQIRWEGLPGFTSTNYPGFLFPPQPSHKWRNMNLVEILMDHDPPVNGPYRIAAWENNASMTLEANPYYYWSTATDRKHYCTIPRRKGEF